MQLLPERVAGVKVARQGFFILLFFCLFYLQARATEPITLTASWYSIQSLKQEGTYKYSKGVMANGDSFRNEDFTCATWLYPLGTRLRVTNIKTGRYVFVKVTDRINKRFAKIRIDLSKRAFREIADLKQGIIKVKIEVIKKQ